MVYWQDGLALGLLLLKKTFSANPNQEGKKESGRGVVEFEVQEEEEELFLEDKNLYNTRHTCT